MVTQYFVKKLFDLEDADDIGFMSEDPSFSDRLNDNVGRFEMCFAHSKCKIPLQDWIGSIMSATASHLVVVYWMRCFCQQRGPDCHSTTWGIRGVSVTSDCRPKTECIIRFRKTVYEIPVTQRLELIGYMAQCRSHWRRTRTRNLFSFT